MPARLKISLLWVLTPIWLLSCKSDPKHAPSDQKPVVDTIRVAKVPKEGAVVFEITRGTVNWTGKKALGGTQTGTIEVKQGELSVNQNQLVGGTVSLDMNSIAVTSIEDGGERKDLESHLKDSDFFDAGKFPEAVFKIEQALPVNNPAYNWLIIGELTMKGKTNPVNIPVQLRIEGSKLVATSPVFPINRTKWGVNFRSSLLGTAKDKLIDDNVLLSLELEARHGE